MSNKGMQIMTIENETALGPILAQAREDAGLSQPQLAKLLGISRWAVSRLEHGHLNFRDEWLDKMPLAIRRPIIRFLQDRHAERIDALEKLTWAERPRAIARPTA